MEKVLIIAEAGVNHNGDIQRAKALVDAAVDAGVDMVKFQTFKADDIVSKKAVKAEYQSKNMGGNDNSQYNMLKALELSESDHLVLQQYCAEKGIQFFSTAFDVKGLNYLNTLGFDRFKVPSGEITNFPYLLKIAELGKPVILSTGMSDLTEVKDAIRVLTSRKLGVNDITVLHCNTDYPTVMGDVNLLAMVSMKDELGTAVGYSDHTLGIEVPIAAVALGGKVIEKHFTLDRNLPGPDHKASLEPKELLNMVKAIRNIEKAISGSGIKEISKSEKKNKIIARKSLHLCRAMETGEIITEKDVIPLRPGDGISPMEWNNVIGKKLKSSQAKWDKLSFEDINT